MLSFFFFFLICNVPCIAVKVRDTERESWRFLGIGRVRIRLVHCFEGAQERMEKKETRADI